MTAHAHERSQTTMCCITCVQVQAGLGRCEHQLPRLARSETRQQWRGLCMSQLGGTLPDHVALRLICRLSRSCNTCGMSVWLTPT